MIEIVNDPDTLARWINALTRAKQEGITARKRHSRSGLHALSVTSSIRRGSYSVTVDARATPWKVNCTCLAGQHGVICKHAAVAVNLVDGGMFGQRCLDALTHTHQKQEAISA